MTHIKSFYNLEYIKSVNAKITAVCDALIALELSESDSDIIAKIVWNRYCDLMMADKCMNNEQ